MGGLNSLMAILISVQQFTFYQQLMVFPNCSRFVPFP